MSDFDVAIHFNPRDANALHNRALLFLRRGERAKAVKDLDEAIRLKPNHAKALFTRSAVYIQSREYDQAIETLSKAISLSPNNALYHLNRAWVYDALGKQDDAIRDANIAIQQTESPDKTYSANDLSHFYDGFNSHSAAYFAELSERRRPRINLWSKVLLVAVYAKKLKSGERAEIEKTQMILRDLGYYTGEIDGIFRRDIVSALAQCVAAVNCPLRIDAVSGLK